MDKKKNMHRKKFSFWFSLSLSLTLALSLTISAQTIKRLRVYQKGGRVDTVKVDGGTALKHSRLAPDGQLCDDYVTLQVQADDSLRQYLLAQLDSLVLPSGRRVVFHGFTVKDNLNENEDENENQNEDENGSRSRYRSRSPWRTYFTGEFPNVATGNVVFHWHDGDRISLDLGWQSRAERLSSDGTRAEFVFDGADGLDANEYTVYYPGRTVTISNTQTQMGPDNSEHIATCGDCGTAIATRQQDGSYDFTLNHKVA